MVLYNTLQRKKIIPLLFTVYTNSDIKIIVQWRSQGGFEGSNPLPLGLKKNCCYNV